MDKLELYLKEFSKVADTYFGRQEEFFINRYNFYKEFFTQEYINNLTWEKIQMIGDNNHAFNRLAIAKKNALGRPNHDISKYKETFEYMAFSDDPIDIKMDNLIFGSYKLNFFGKSVISELIGYVNPEKYYIYNLRDKSAIEFLGIDLNFKRGDTFGTQYLKYIKIIQKIEPKYEELVGKRTSTTIPLEVDQFFCWLYEYIIKKPASDLDQEKIEAYLEDYKMYIKTADYDELYKWRAVKTFQDNWDINASDFKEMFNRSLEGNTNLWIARNFYPKGVINDYIDMDKEKVRKMFEILFDENINLSERIKYFVNECDKFLLIINKPNFKQHFQNAMVISLYLMLKYPDKYFLYKNRVFKNFSYKVGLKINNPKDYSERLSEYFTTAEKVKSFIEKDEELVKMNKEMLTDDCYKDNNLNILTQDFIYMTSEFLGVTVSESDSNILKEEIRYWAISPGAGSIFWNEWKEKGIITIGWDDLGDLKSYPDKESIREKLKGLRDPDSDQKHRTVACYEFSRIMNPGDIVFAKSGTKYYLGMGIITSDYIFDNLREKHKNLRKVDWQILKDIEIPDDVGYVATKAMTDITKYPNYVKKVLKLFDESYKLKRSTLENEIVSDKDEINYWWLNANPSIWRIEDYEIGEEQTYTSHNDQGNKRRIYEYFTKVKKGDLIIGYESSPVRKVKAIYEVTKPLHLDDDEGEIFTFKIKEFLPNQIKWEDLCNLKSIEDSEIMKNNQGSLFKLTKEEYEFIIKLAKKGKPELLEIYNKEIALKDLFIKEVQLDSILDALKIKKNIILQGPPGTGKTYIAKKIAYLMMGRKDNSKIEQVQFHQSYSYEDFIQGYRPSDKNNFILKNGIFYDFCKRAQNDSNSSYFFIVDEINRGNLSKIFGELMMLIENDKRGKNYAISLTYSKYEDDKFYIPENLYFIGTMNTADRSLALVDYALRRRFRFINILPEFGEKFKDYLKIKNIPNNLIEKIISGISKVNEIISKDQNLGYHFAIGHSYFCNFNDTPNEYFYSRIIENEIEPLLREYWFDDNDKIEECIRILSN